jgi:hypothetical protein
MSIYVSLCERERWKRGKKKKKKKSFYKQHVDLIFQTSIDTPPPPTPLKG